MKAGLVVRPLATGSERNFSNHLSGLMRTLDRMRIPGRTHRPVREDARLHPTQRVQGPFRQPAAVKWTNRLQDSRHSLLSPGPLGLAAPTAFLRSVLTSVHRHITLRS